MLIVEDGTGLANSTSYASLEFAGQYNGARAPNREVWLQHDHVEHEAAMTDGAKLLHTMFKWKGTIKVLTPVPQALDFPRVGLVDDEGRLVPSNSVPLVVMEAQCQAAYRLLAKWGSSTAVGLSNIKSERIGDYSVTYRDALEALEEWPELARILGGLTVVEAVLPTDILPMMQQTRVRYT